MGLRDDDEDLTTLLLDWRADHSRPFYLATTVQPEEIQVGTIVRAKEQKFKILEVEDGSILVATMGKLSKKDIEDMKAFLARYFTPEQIAKLLGDPELLSDELVAQFFGGQGEHICFRASADLFAKF